MIKQTAQKIVDEQNRAFWNELCGTSLARGLGITEHSLDSLQKFDRAYLEFYPYLSSYLRDMSGKKVLEIGIGYGTVARELASKGADYWGLDIAAGPVWIVNHWMKLRGLNGTAIVGSALDAPFKSDSFDAVISIGCLHHTGNMQKAVDEIWRVLKPQGQAVIMMYNNYSLRRWLGRPLGLFKEVLLGKSAANTDEAQRAKYDTNTRGKAAPFTEFCSIARLKVLFRRFLRVRYRLENIDDLRFPGCLITRRTSLLNNFAHLVGLDWYVTATKP